MNKRNILYRIYGDNDRLLYVGATTNPSLRFVAHQHQTIFWDEATHITLEHFDTPEELFEAEKEAIGEDPEYNIQHHEWNTLFRQRTQTRRTRGDGTVFQRADGNWVAGIQLPWKVTNGKRRYKRFVRKTRKEAELALEQFRRQMEEARENQG